MVSIILCRVHTYFDIYFDIYLLFIHRERCFLRERKSEISAEQPS